jgi:competence protein ComEA
MSRENGIKGQLNKYWWIAFGVLFGVGAAGLILLLSGPPRGRSILLSPAATSAPLIVHVSGAVRNPGLYEVPLGSRSQDAIDAAGGVIEDADTDRINLARVLVDGQQVHIPFQGEDSGEVLSFPLNINLASVEQLSQLPSIGPVTAQAIVNYRDSNGPFRRIEDIQNVSGIGPNTFQNIEDLISLDG